MPKDKSAKSQKSSMSSTSLANPEKLKPLKSKPAESTSGTSDPGTELLQVIIETPRGSRNKYSFDEEQRTFLLKAALPTGMVFPYDFGFLPQTLGGDGDPLDVLVLMDEPCFPGCAVPARLIGVMEAEQTQNGETNRNDRLLAIADTAHLYANITNVDDLPERFRTEISEFFSNYHRLQKKESKLLGWKGPNKARKLIEQGQHLAQQKQSEP